MNQVTLDSRVVVLLKSYWLYHQNFKNRLTHFIGIPIVVTSLWIAMGWVRFDALGITLATGAYLFMLVFYLRLDRLLGVLFAAVGLPFLYLAHKVASMQFSQSLTIFLTLFVLGWVFQFLGHYYEGKRPAFFNNSIQLLTGPLFLIAELAFALGMRAKLKALVEAKS
jgi:uncharacterized membrane protein YGL010W